MGSRIHATLTNRKIIVTKAWLSAIIPSESDEGGGGERMNVTVGEATFFT